MINIGYRAARIQGNSIRSIYLLALSQIANRPITQTRRVPLAVYSFSSHKDLSEQIASIRSFIRHVGIPDKFTVISDGSHLEADCMLIRKINPCVEVIVWEDLIRADLPQYIYDYAYNHPHHHAMGKRLAVFMSLSIEQPTLYTDSDILFFPESEELINLCLSNDVFPWYLPDCAAALDERILLHESEKLNPVNAGFFLLKKQLDWEMPLHRLSQLKELPIFHTDQTLIHLAIHAAQGKPFSKNKFILQLDDEFIYPDRYASSQIAMRHYVNPVRHKFWLNVV